MPDFYFAYDYNESKNTASRLCRHLNHSFEEYNKANNEWEYNIELSRIIIGEDIYYDEITEQQALDIIKNWNS